MPRGRVNGDATAVLGNNPMVVTIAFAATSWPGGNVTVIAATPNGPSNVIGRLSEQVITELAV